MTYLETPGMTIAMQFSSTDYAKQVTLVPPNGSQCANG